MKMGFKDFEAAWDTASCGGYTGLVKLFGFEILANASFGSYQGDEVYVLKDAVGRFGLLVQGYGSCSVCDWYEGCISVNDYYALYESMYDSVRWFDTMEELWAYSGSEEAMLANWWANDESVREVLRKFSSEY